MAAGTGTLRTASASGKLEDQDLKAGVFTPEQSTIRMEGFDGRARLEYTPTGSGIKENIILPVKGKRTQFMFRLETEGLNTELAEDNTVVFSDAETGEPLYMFPAPFMTDAKGEISYSVYYELMEDGLFDEPEKTDEAAVSADEAGGSCDEGAESSGGGAEEKAEAEKGGPGAAEETEAGTEGAPVYSTESPGAEAATTDAAVLPAEEKELKEEAPADGAESAVTDANESGAPGEAEKSAVYEGEEEAEGSEGTVINDSEEGEEVKPEEERSDTDLTGKETVYLKVTADADWLSAAAYPVTIDPVLKDYSTWCAEYCTVCSDGSRCDSLKAGKSGDKYYKGLVRLDIDLPKNAQVSEALLYLSGIKSDALNSKYVTAHLACGAWSKDTVSWDDRPAEGKLIDYLDQTNEYINITEAVRRWQNGEENNGFVLSYGDTDGFCSLELNLCGHMVFSLTYRTENGLEDKWSTHSASAGTAGTAYVNDCLGYLTAVRGDVASAGGRMPLSVSHVYNSMDTDKGNGWRLNLEETVRIPADTQNICLENNMRDRYDGYPYVWTDGDGTEHYFERISTIEYWNNGQKETAVPCGGDPKYGRDEDGLGLYIIPLTGSEYAFKMFDKSSSEIRYYDRFGRLGMIRDSNRYENGGNGKADNRILITWGIPEGSKERGKAFTATRKLFADAVEAARDYKDNSDALAALIKQEERDKYQISPGYRRQKEEERKKAEEERKKAEEERKQEKERLQKAVNEALTKLKADTDILLQDSYVRSDRILSENVVSAVKKAKSSDSSAYSDLVSAQTRFEDIYNCVEGNARDYGAERILKVEDAAGKTAVFTYEDDRISTVTDPSYGDGLTGKNTYTYDENGNLTGVTYADGRTACYEYGDDTDEHLLTALKSYDGYRIDYSYDQNGRVVSVKESVETEDGKREEGQQYTVTYRSNNASVFRFSGINDIYGDEDDIENTECFDETGKTTCVYSTLTGQTRVLGAVTAVYTEDDTEAKNKIKESAVTGIRTANLLTDHSFESGSSAWKTYGTCGTVTRAGGIQYAGYCGQSVPLSGLSAESGCSQEVTLSEGTYTFSAYCRYESGEQAGSSDTPSAYLKACAEGCELGRSPQITDVTPEEFDDGWQRLSVTFELTEEQTVTLSLAVDPGKTGRNGTVTFDCAQLEEGSCANAYNYLENTGFEHEEDGKAAGWGGKSCSEDEYVAEGEKSCRITGSLKGQTEFSADLYLKPDVSYVLSGWVKTDITPMHKINESGIGERAAQLIVRMYGTDEKQREVKDSGETVYKSLNAYTDEWQYFSMILPRNTGTRVNGVEACIQISTGARTREKRNGCIGDIYIDGLQLTANDSRSNDYDRNGYLRTSTGGDGTSEVYHDSYGRVAGKRTGDGKDYRYSYDPNNDVSSVTADGVTTNYTYDTYGNVIHSSTEHSYNREFLTYTPDGRFLTSRRDQTEQTTDYSYNTVTGKLDKTLLPARTDGEDRVEVSSTYDKYGNTTSVSRGTAAGSGSDAQDLQKTSFSYSDRGELTGIRHNGFDYGLEYDGFGNALSVSVAGQVLTETEYAAKNGRALMTVTADGVERKEEYNEYGDVTAYCVKSAAEDEYTPVKEYTYLNSGYPGETRDNITGKTEKYTYDLTGRVTGSEVYTNEGLAEGRPESRLQYTYGDGGKIKGITYQEQSGEVRKYSYGYVCSSTGKESGRLARVTLPAVGSGSSEVSSTLSNCYDEYKRPKSVSLSTGAKNNPVTYTESLEYLHLGEEASGQFGGTDTDLVAAYTNSITGLRGTQKVKNKGTTYSYTYDNWGNLTSVHTGARTVSGITFPRMDAETVTERSYEYDAHSQITSAEEGNGAERKKYSYTYDAGGNITSETVATVRNGNKTAETVNTYRYASEGWKDQLVSYNGKAITYDVMGRPVNYMGDAMEWNEAGLLKKVSASGKSTLVLNKNGEADFTYSADGARVKKTVTLKDTYSKVTETKTVTSRYNNGLLLSEMTETKAGTGRNTLVTYENLHYYYDSNGRVISIGLAAADGTGKEIEDETAYFLVYNGQGDVAAIYRSSDGVLMGTYEYDLWGKPIRTVSTSADTRDITDKNPIRYRSYYYDTETGLYYLNARYYDPSLRKFLNADSLAFMGGGDAASYNLYAYCENNPVNRRDSTGQYAETIEGFGGFFETAAREVWNAIKEMAGYYATCAAGALCDGPLPVADVVVAGVAVGISAYAVVKGIKKASQAKADKKTNNNKQKTKPSKLQNQVGKGKAPRQVERVDGPDNNRPGSKAHIHFGKGYQSLNEDGTWGHTGNDPVELTNETIEWIIENGWTLPKGY